MRTCHFECIKAMRQLLWPASGRIERAVARIDSPATGWDLPLKTLQCESRTECCRQRAWIRQIYLINQIDASLLDRCTRCPGASRPQNRFKCRQIEVLEQVVTWDDLNRSEDARSINPIATIRAGTPAKAQNVARTKQKAKICKFKQII